MKPRPIQNINLHGSLTFIQTTADGCWSVRLRNCSPSRSLAWHLSKLRRHIWQNMWHKQAWRELLSMKACPFSFWPQEFINKRLLLALTSEFISAADSRPSAAHACPHSDGRMPSWQMLIASSQREKHKLASQQTKPGGKSPIDQRELPVAINPWFSKGVKWMNTLYWGSKPHKYI